MSISGLMETFMQIRPALQRFLTLRGATPAEAEDILQDISLKLARGGIGPVSEARAYLYRMASNQFGLHRRTEQRRSRREGDWVDTHGGSSKDADPDGSAEQRLIQREQLEILNAALARLPERTRHIFVRFRVEGAPQKHIAQEQGITLSAVEKHLTRAYQEIARTRLALDAGAAPAWHLKEKGGVR